MREQNKISSKYFPLLLFAAGLILRLTAALFYSGFANDIACFAAWSDRMFSVGPGNFYSSEVFTDYPPGFMYLLYIIGALKAILQLKSFSAAHLVLLKLPAILCDIITGYLIYREAKGLLPHLSQALLLTAAYLFNPAVLLNSAVWGQVDSVYTLAVILLCLFLIRGKLFPAYLSFGIGILLKPQMLIFTPVLLTAILDMVFLKDFSFRKLFCNLSQGLLVIAGMFLVCLPFHPLRVFQQFFSTLGSYPYAAVNAYNFWGLLGLNWVSQDRRFLFMSCKSWGMLVIILIVLVTFLLSLKMKNHPGKYPLLAAFIILTMFVFSVRMHERYMYAGLALLIFTYLYHPIRPFAACYVLFSLLHFGNTAHVLFCYDAANYDRKAPIILALSGGMVLSILYFYYLLAQICCRQNK